MPKKGYGGVTLKDETLARLDALGYDSRAAAIRGLLDEVEA